MLDEKSKNKTRDGFGIPGLLAEPTGTDVYCFPSSRPLGFPHIVTKQANDVREGRAEASQITQ